MDVEMAEIKKNNTYRLVPPTDAGDRKIVGCKWVFDKQRNDDGSLKRYKARLCAKGFTQVKGIDYEETFAPVVKSTVLKMFFAIAAIMDWTVEQGDIKCAFTTSALTIRIFMKQPQYYVDPTNPHHLWELEVGNVQLP